MSECRSCGAPIRFARTARGRFLPLDREPSPDGNVLVWRGQASVVRAGQLAAVQQRARGGDADGLLYMPHWQSCPHADDWRRR